MACTSLSQLRTPASSQKRKNRFFLFEKLRWRSMSRSRSRVKSEDLTCAQSEKLNSPKQDDFSHSHEEHVPSSLKSSSSEILSGTADPADSNTYSEFPVARPKDLWSTAYHEALRDSADEVKQVILTGERIETLLTTLQQANEELAGDSLFRRGLQRLQGPLKSFKLALDLASPFAGIHVAASTAVGIVNCVTTIAIAVCGAESSFDAQIVRMLERVTIIDECDTLGQKLDAGNGIHKALVPVYKDLLSFYTAAFKILTSKAFVLALACNELNQQIPTIVADFVKHAADLRERIGNATLELLTDIKKLLQDRKVQRLLGVDKEKLRSKLHSKLRESRARGACEWIVKDPKFLQWRSASSSALLVLLGHMGCGKTVITAHTIEELIRLNGQMLPRPLICYHYCESGERGSELYIYSSLILQLLDQQEGLKIEFDQWYEKTKKHQHIDPVCCADDLGKFLSACIKNLDRELFVVIDALDECGSTSRSKVIELLNDLSNKTQSLKIFLSSRPDEVVENSFQKATFIHWSPDRERDEIIVNHLVESRLMYLCPESRTLVTRKLTELAQGSAIWIELTVHFVCKSGIRKLGLLNKLLTETPPPTELRQLYSKLFTQVTGGLMANKRLAASALEILAVARRPLSIPELGWSVALSDPCADTQTLVQLEACVDEQRILHLLRPFLHQLDLQDREQKQVRLVHKSLQDMILADDPLDWDRSEHFHEELHGHHQPVAHRRQTEIETSFVWTCVKYLLFDEFNEKPLFSDEDEITLAMRQWDGCAASNTSKNDVDKLTASGTSASPSDEGNIPGEKELYYKPVERGFGEFYAYASCFWMDHSRVSDPNLWPEILNVAALCEAGSRRLSNWIRQSHRPDCTIEARWGEDDLNQDPLTIVSLHGSEAMLEMLLRDDRFDYKSKLFLPNTIEQTITQILQRGDLSRLATLFHDPRIGPELQHPDYIRQLMREWCRSDKVSASWTVAFDLVSNIHDEILLQNGQGNELLCSAAQYGCLPVIERLFDKAARNEAIRHEILRDIQRSARYSISHQSIGEAIWHNHVDVLRYLLKQEGIEAHLRHRDARGRNAFHLAAHKRNAAVMSLLILHFPDGADQLDQDGDTPLCVVVFGSQGRPEELECAKMLLMDGHAEVRARFKNESSSNYFEPLRMAARSGDTAMCQELVEVGGADPRSVLRFIDQRPQLVDHNDCSDSEQAHRVLATLCSLAGLDC